MKENNQKELPLLKELYTTYGEQLLKEIAVIVYKNGQGDCYNVKCAKYCLTENCDEAIKYVVRDLILGEYNVVK